MAQDVLPTTLIAEQVEQTPNATAILEFDPRSGGREVLKKWIYREVWEMAKGIAKTFGRTVKGKVESGEQYFKGRV